MAWAIFFICMFLLAGLIIVMDDGHGMLGDRRSVDVGSAGWEAFPGGLGQHRR